jgi:hypothetical protein
MTLTEQLRALIAEHDLTALSVTAYRRTDGTVYFGAYAHSDVTVGSSMSLNCDDESPAEVIASAINELNAKRHKPVDVSEMEGL